MCFFVVEVVLTAPADEKNLCKVSPILELKVLTVAFRWGLEPRCLVLKTVQNTLKVLCKTDMVTTK